MSWRIANAWRLIGAGYFNPESVPAPEFPQELLQGRGGTIFKIATSTFAVERYGLPAFEMSDVHRQAVADPTLSTKDVEFSIEVFSQESEIFEECGGHCERGSIVCS